MGKKYDTEKLGYYLVEAEKRCMPYVMFWVRDTHIAEDICQEACIGVLEKLKKEPLTGDDAVFKLMKDIARKRICNYFKKASTQNEISMEDTAMDFVVSGPESDGDLMKDLLYEGIKSLKVKEKFIMHSRLEGMSNEELGEALGISPHAVECIYSRTLGKLKKLYRKQQDF